MHNKVKFIIFLSYVINASSCLGVNYNFDEIESFVGRTMENMEKASMETIESAKKQLEELKKHMAKELQQTERSIKGFTDQVGLKVELDVSDEKDGVQVVVKLPKKSQLVTMADKVELEAKGNSLDGTLNYGGFEVKIAIADGQVAQISYKYNIHDEKKDANGRSFKHISSISTQSLVLPTPVDNLENTKAEFRDGKLILILPKKQAIARGWRRIEVK